jgi:hypothetical protein
LIQVSFNIFTKGLVYLDQVIRVVLIGPYMAPVAIFSSNDLGRNIMSLAKIPFSKVSVVFWIQWRKMPIFL